VLLLNSGEATEFVAVFGLADEPPGSNGAALSGRGDAMGRLTVGAVKR
jgi:hypothetical protein